ncbi:MAG: hypothetical protein A2Y73_08385 [Chloroflexi bacterium RBG_13_56_8]|nr:MAG: hypothetical protein A2Y73_08385 [Chloroflexi bacterium RBG_13_56_8]
MIVARNRGLSILVLSVLVLVLSCAAPATQPGLISRAELIPPPPPSSSQAELLPPSLPSSFYGTVRIDGENVPESTEITVGNGGVIYARTVSFLYEGISVYNINAPADRMDTPERDGGVQGEVLEFTVAGLHTDLTAIWRCGANEEVPLAGMHEARFFNLTKPLIFLPFVMRAP